MFGSTILELAIGLVFLFSAVSLVTSSINEAIASALKLRSKTLLSGVQALLNDPEFNGLARDLYNHSLVHPRGNGLAETPSDIKLLPAYISAPQFAAALTDVLKQAPAASGVLANGIANLPDPQLRQMFVGIFDRVKGDVDRFQAEVGAWFNEGMDRVSGSYKRTTQIISFVVAVLVCGMVNIDAFHAASVLWQHPSIAAGIATHAPSTSANAFDSLSDLGFPIGWEKCADARCGSTSGIAIMIGGWLTTAAATLFGAPFWFDTLQRISRLAGVGPKPASAPNE